MDFGKTLSEWNKMKKKKQSDESELMKNWLDKHPPTDEDKKLKAADLKEISPKKVMISERQRLRNMKPQKTLDLHGFTVKEATVAVENFFKICQAQGIEKVLIIYGKGIHSQDGPVLNQKIRQFIERSPLAGEMGTPPAQMGGRGALWVIIKK